MILNLVKTMTFVHKLDKQLSAVTILIVRISEDASGYSQACVDEDTVVATIIVRHLHAPPPAVSPVQVLVHVVHRQTVYLPYI